MPQTRPEVLAYYAQGREAGRLAAGSTGGPLELARTVELLDRFLPTGPLDILDVGGGPGVYARWLTDRGHQVHLVDPVPLHVEQAREAGLSAEVGDARALTQASASCDVVLLMGPLYHLIESSDRQQALAEARRVLRPGGLLVATAIGRYAALQDLLVRLDRLHEPDTLDRVTTAVQTGVLVGKAGGIFTTAYFHLPSQLAAEIAAGFEAPEILGIEGPGFLVRDFDARWADPARRDAMLAAARLVESDQEMHAAASHLLAVARRP